MRLRTGLFALSAAACAAAALSATPAMADGRGGHGDRHWGSHGGGAVFVRQTSPGHWGGPFGTWYGGWQPGYVVETGSPPPSAYEPVYDRDSWLRECRRRLGDNGVGGAVLGAVVGGVAGHAIAGHGDKALGTVAGAAVGAVAGAAIDKAEDAPRNRDRCAAMLDSGPAYAGGYAPVMMVPVVMVPGQSGTAQTGAPVATGQPCTETVVTEEFYEDAPRRSRHIPRRAPAPDKRVRMTPDKRVMQ